MSVLMSENVYFCTVQNLALHGKASLSTLYSNVCKAKNAINGNHASVWEKGNCACTHLQLNPWFEVDLGKTSRVSTIKYTNSNYEVVNGAEIRIGNHPVKSGTKNPR